jgi:hypothetical protein
VANSVYPKALQGFMTKTIDMSGDNIKSMLVDATYSYSTAHQYVSDVASGAIIQRGGSNLGTKTETSGVFDAADFTHTAVPTGHTVAAIIVYDDTPATDATKPLLAFIDHDASAVAISLPTNGGDITIQWNASGIFSI